MYGPFICRAWLAERSACEPQIVLFESEWPDGRVAEEESIRRAGEIGLFLGWFAPHVLSDDGLAVYTSELVELTDAYDTARRAAKAKLTEERERPGADVEACKRRYEWAVKPHLDALAAARAGAIMAGVRAHGWRR